MMITTMVLRRSSSDVGRMAGRVVLFFDWSEIESSGVVDGHENIQRYFHLVHSLDTLPFDARPRALFLVEFHISLVRGILKRNARPRS